MATPPDFTAGQVLTAAQMNAVGLWKITPSSVSGTGATIAGNGDVVVSSGGTSVTIVDCFTSDYSNYKVIVSNIQLASTAGMTVQLRTASTTKTTGYYWAGYLVNYTAGFASADSRGTNTSSWAGSIGTTGRVAFSFEVFDPYDAVITTYMGARTDPRTDGAVGSYYGYQNSAEGFTSLVIGSSANMTNARVSVYGYN
jgi:hypothetical protein